MTKRSERQRELLKRRGFNSEYEYKKWLAARRGRTIYEERLENLKVSGFDSMDEYLDFLAKRKGYRSHFEYRMNIGKRVNVEI